MITIPDTITEQELNILVEKAKKPKLKATLKILFYEALRVSDLVNLKPENVDMVSGFLHIKRSKGKKDRDVPIMPPAVFYFRYLPINLTRQAIHKQVRRLGLKYLNKDIHPHTLRHSGATFYLNEKGMDIRYIKDLLGHSRLSTTEIYTHVNPQQLKNAFDKAWR